MTNRKWTKQDQIYSDIADLDQYSVDDYKGPPVCDKYNNNCTKCENFECAFNAKS